MAFNRDRNSRPGGGFKSRPSFGNRPRFGDRGDRSPVEMHKAICDNCSKECEVPFRPTSGKPIYCSNCFESKRGSDSERGGGRNFERPRFEEKQMFDAKCDECGNSCQVPFRPSGDKPIYCSNCFGEKKNNGTRNTEASSPTQYNQQFEELNKKLDKVLSILLPIATEVETLEKSEETGSSLPEVEETTEKKTKAPKKPSKSKSLEQ